GDELFLSTSRGIVHVFDTGAYGALGPQGTPQNHLLLPGRVLGTGDLDLDGLAEFLVRSEEGLEAWDVSPVRAVLRLVTPAQPIDFVHIVSSEGVMVTSGPWGFARYDRRGATY